MRSLRLNAARLSGASITPIIDFGSRFLRTVLLSRLLTPADLGACVVLVTVLTSCEFITDMGLDAFVVVHTRINAAQAVAVTRQISIGRSVLISLLILVLAPFLADALGAQGLVSSIRWLSIAPLIRGFRNFRTLQVQNEYRYKPDSIARGVADLSALAAVVPAFAWFHDERAMLASLILEAVVYVSISYLVLPPERVAALDPAIRKLALKFGFPLLINGVGLIILSQLDRMIVAKLFGLAVLALYSLVINLVSAPVQVCMTVLGKVLVPFMVRSKQDPIKSREASLTSLWLMFICATGYALAAGAVLNFAVPWLYGQQYQVPGEFAPLVTLLAFSRFCRSALGGVFLAHGETGRLTAATLLSAGGLVIGLALAIVYGRVEAVLVGSVVADMVALSAALYFARRLLPIGVTLRHFALLSLPVLLAAISLSAAGSSVEARTAILVLGGMLIGLDVGMGYHLPAWRISSLTPRNYGVTVGIRENGRETL